MLVTFDVIGLYTNIPQDEGIMCVEEALSERQNSAVSTAFIIRMLDITLKYNIFEFDENLYKQEIGTAMWSCPAPSYANIFMARRIDEQIKHIIKLYSENDIQITILKRFLDDIFTIYIGSTKNIHNILHDYRSSSSLAYSSSILA